MSKGKRGRPRTRISTQEFTRKMLVQIIQYDVESLTEQLLRQEGIVLSRTPKEKVMKWFMSESKLKMFHEGIRYALSFCAKNVIPDTVDRLMDVWGVRMNVSLEIARRLKIQEKHPSLFMEPLPSDLKRKVRKPVTPKVEISKFTRLVKEIAETETPYVSHVAQRLGMTEAEVRAKIIEARRQRRAISIEKGPHNKELIILG